MDGEIQILLNELIEAINRPDWWVIGITAINAVIIISLTIWQLRLNKRQNEIQEYQNKLQEQQNQLQEQQIKQQEYAIYRQLYIMVSRVNTEIKYFFHNIDYALWTPIYNQDKEYLKRKQIEIEDLERCLTENYIDYDLKFSKEIFDNKGYSQILSLMKYTLQQINTFIKDVEIEPDAQIKSYAPGSQEDTNARAIVMQFGDKDAQLLLSQCFEEFIKQKRELNCNNNILQKIRDYCRIE